MKKIILISSIVILAMIFTCFVALLVNEIYMNSSTERNEYNISDEFQNIDIISSTDNIKLCYSANGENKVYCSENKYVKYNIEVIDGTLYIKEEDSRKIKISILNFIKYSVEVYLNNEALNNLNIQNDTGEILINQELRFQNIDIQNDTGDIKLFSNCDESIEIESSTGDVELLGIDSSASVNIKNDTGNIKIGNSNVGTIDIKTDTGNVDLSEVNCDSLSLKISTGRTNLDSVIVVNNLDIKGSTGDVKLDGCDALNINITLDTGSVKGTILTSKFFICKSNTGRVDVPETRDGGECRITVDTGNIIINYK